MYNYNDYCRFPRVTPPPPPSWRPASNPREGRLKLMSRLVVLSMMTRNMDVNVKSNMTITAYDYYY